MNRQVLVVASVVALLVAFVVGAAQYRSSRAESLTFLAQEDAHLFAPPHAMTTGSPSGRVVLVEFFDPACETCRQLYGHVKQLLVANPGRILLVYRYAPFHPGSEDVVKMLEASRKQDLYHETLEVMYRYQDRWASHHQPRLDALWAVLPEAGLDMAKLEADLKDPALDAIVKQDLADADALGVRKTPEFFVNGKPLPSFGLQQLHALVQQEIAIQYE